jgi:hypothetical protein
MPNKTIRQFFVSFFKYYAKYDMHDAPNDEALLFWKASNFCNGLIKIVLIIMAFVFVYSLI